MEAVALSLITAVWGQNTAGWPTSHTLDAQPGWSWSAGTYLLADLVARHKTTIYSPFTISFLSKATIDILSCSIEYQLRELLQCPSRGEGTTKIQR